MFNYHIQTKIEGVYKTHLGRKQKVLEKRYLVFALLFTKSSSGFLSQHMC